MTAVHLSPEALTDLDAIWDYIAKDSPANADGFIERLVQTVTSTLATAPRAGRVRDEFDDTLRSFPFERYLVMYRVQKDAVQIVRIIHGARDLSAIFDS